jgi:hypothetical protein
MKKFLIVLVALAFLGCEKAPTYIYEITREDKTTEIVEAAYFETETFNLAIIKNGKILTCFYTASGKPLAQFYNIDVIQKGIKEK